MPEKWAVNGFAAGAAADLEYAAGAVADTKNAAQDGKLTLDVDGAEMMLAALDALRAKADRMIVEAQELDEPLRFGRNWVGDLMSERFREAAGGDHGSVHAVLSGYRTVLEEVELTIRAAAGLYTTQESDAVEYFTRLVHHDKPQREQS